MSVKSVLMTRGGHAARSVRIHFAQYARRNEGARAIHGCTRAVGSGAASSELSFPIKPEPEPGPQRLRTTRMIKTWSVPECARLTAEFERLRRLYGMAVDHLFTVGHQVTDAEYEELKNSVDDARVLSEIAGMNLANHRLAVHSKAG